MKEAFRSKVGLSTANQSRLTTINKILEEYRIQGYVLTLRQLYYQLVSRDIILNNVKEYGKLSILLTKGRMAGIVDWSAIEDRGRQPKIPFSCDGVKDGIQTLLNQYRLNRQMTQPNYVEIWVEKDALSNIFLRVTEKYHVRLMVNKGYSSCSAMYEAAKRFKEHMRYGQAPVLLYFGDHDPSGKDMVRDIEDRLIEMGVDDLQVLNPALNMSQVEQYDPPENPAKITDPRAKEYIAKYGDHSWELDALTPDVLIQIITDALLEFIDIDLFDEIRDKEKKQKAQMAEWADSFEDE